MDLKQTAKEIYILLKPYDIVDFEFGVDNSSVDFVGAALFAGLASVAVLGSIGTLAVGYCDIDWGD